jgi:hypothetical protein
MEPRQCRICGEGLETSDRRQWYCTDCQAKRKAENQRAIRLRRGQGQGARLACQRCGTEFVAGRKDAKWCASCKVAVARQRADDAPLVSASCQRCGTDFAAGNRLAKFCDACKRPQDATRRVTVLTADPRISQLSCLRCQQPFEALRSDAKYCPECRVPAQRKADFQRFEQRHKQRCIDCGALVYRRSERCKACGNKERGARQTGENNPTWKGGRTKSSDGYIFVRHKHGRSAYRGEHIVVWEQKEGRPLPQGWVVHHLNGIKTDNRPENLAGMPRHEHHSHPREALRPYEHRIRELERQLADCQST